MQPLTLDQVKKEKPRIDVIVNVGVHKIKRIGQPTAGTDKPNAIFQVCSARYEVPWGDIVQCYNDGTALTLNHEDRIKAYDKKKGA